MSKMSAEHLNTADDRADATALEVAELRAEVERLKGIIDDATWSVASISDADLDDIATTPAWTYVSHLVRQARDRLNASDISPPPIDIDKVARALRKKLGLAPLTIEEAEKAYDEAPEVPLSQEQIDRIMHNVRTIPAPDDEDPDKAF